MASDIPCVPGPESLGRRTRLSLVTVPLGWNGHAHTTGYKPMPAYTIEYRETTQIVYAGIGHSNGEMCMISVHFALWTVTAVVCRFMNKTLQCPNISYIT